LSIDKKKPAVVPSLEPASEVTVAPSVEPASIVYFRIAAGIIILFLLTLLFVGEPAPPLVAGTLAPQTKVTSYDNVDWDLTERFIGQFSIVNFWATWCGPCRYEIPHLVKLQDKYSDRLHVFGLAIDSPAKAVAKSVNEFGINYPVVKVEEQVVDLWRASAVPATYLIDPKGYVLWSTKGAINQEKLQQVVDKFLFSAK